jgi:uncharacterized protein
MYSRFGLVLMVNHACNLRCSYCYTGLKFTRAMPEKVANHSIDRALASLQPGGTLELSFFGGEPLLEAALINSTIQYARQRCAESEKLLALNITTNGTIDSQLAWQIMTLQEMDLAISFDGLPEIHDRHRKDLNGAGSSARVLATMRRLLMAKKEFQVIVVVRPDNVASLATGLKFLCDFGVDLVTPSLDLWTAWSAADLRALEKALEECARVWRSSLPTFGVSWFNEKAVQLANVPFSRSARCSFGDGEIAVAPSGNLYPCERLIGEDPPDNPARLPGQALLGVDFIARAPACGTAKSCSLSCSCSNLVRSGKTDTPDELLELLDRVCLRETHRVLTAEVA